MHDDLDHLNRNYHREPGAERAYSPLDAIRHVAQAGALADGRPLPSHLKVTLYALAAYYPTIRPTLETLARDTGLLRSTVAAHLRELGDLDLVRTRREGRTAYRHLQFDNLVRVADPRRYSEAHSRSQ